MSASIQKIVTTIVALALWCAPAWGGVLVITPDDIAQVVTGPGGAYIRMTGSYAVSNPAPVADGNNMVYTAYYLDGLTIESIKNAGNLGFVAPPGPLPSSGRWTTSGQPRPDVRVPGDIYKVVIAGNLRKVVTTVPKSQYGMPVTGVSVTTLFKEVVTYPAFPPTP